MGLHEPPCPLQLLALDSGHHETGQARPQPVSQDHPAASARLLSLSPGKVLNLVLLNSSNLCYANSGVLAVLWSIASTQQGLRIQLWEMLRLLHWLTRKPRRVSLPSLRVWQSITFDWQDPHSQHDAAEFLGFLSPALVSTSDAGRWEARLSVDPSTPDALPHQVVDHGQMWPLVLTTALSPAAEGANRAEWTLQSLIIRWRNQVVQHAAVTSPPILPLQLNRFGQDGSKVLNPISLSLILCSSPALRAKGPTRSLCSTNSLQCSIILAKRRCRAIIARPSFPAELQCTQQTITEALKPALTQTLTVFVGMHMFVS